MTVVRWGEHPAEAELPWRLGDLVLVRGSAGRFRDELQINADDIRTPRVLVC